MTRAGKRLQKEVVVTGSAEVTKHAAHGLCTSLGLVQVVCVWRG